jgi:hypothetical protein
MKLLIAALVIVSVFFVGALALAGYWTVCLTVVGLTSIAGAEVYARSKRPVKRPA